MLSPAIRQRFIRRLAAFVQVSFKLTKKDQNVLKEFADKKPAKSDKLTSNGKILQGLWMGGGLLASWKGDKVIVEDTGGKSIDTIQNPPSGNARMGARSLISILNGSKDPRIWDMAISEEPPVKGTPKACDGCPLRKGGEWEIHTKEALRKMSIREKKRMERWGCHQPGARPCAGMRRLLHKDVS